VRVLPFITDFFHRFSYGCGEAVLSERKSLFQLGGAGAIHIKFVWARCWISWRLPDFASLLGDGAVFG